MDAFEKTIRLAEELPCEIRQAFLSKMKPEYDLYYVDYNESVSENVIQKCIEASSPEPMYNEYAEGYDYQWADSCDEEIKSLKNQIIKDDSYSQFHHLIDDWLDIGFPDNRDLIRHEIGEREKGDLYKDLIRNTKSVHATVTLRTNEVGLPDNFDCKSTYEYTDYFKQIVDALSLNPFELKKKMYEWNMDAIGEFPDIQERNGNEAVLYEEFVRELREQSSWGCLVFMGLLPLEAMYENAFKPYKHLILPKGTRCGIYGDWVGGGSIMEMFLLRDIYIPYYNPQKMGYDGFELEIDVHYPGRSSVQECYDFVNECWESQFQVEY